MTTLTSPPPNRHRLALWTWLGVYPVLTAIAWLLEPWLTPLALPLRTLVMSAMMVPAMVYAVMPLIQRTVLNSTPSFKEVINDETFPIPR